MGRLDPDLVPDRLAFEAHARALRRDAVASAFATLWRSLRTRAPRARPGPVRAGRAAAVPVAR
jgi:hypothetical protein